jgi:hypothetical protein
MHLKRTGISVSGVANEINFWKNSNIKNLFTFTFFADKSVNTPSYVYII